MSLTISIPANVEQQLMSVWGNRFERNTLEALAAEGCRSGALSVGEVADMLDISINDADGFLKDREIFAYDTLADIDSGIDLEKLLTR